MPRPTPLAFLLPALLLCACGDGGANEQLDGGKPDGLPTELPFAVARADVGTGLTADERAAFTRKVTGFWKQVDYFNWLLRVSHGVDASTGQPDYMMYWTGVDVTKAGGLVTFAHNGGHDNIMIPTGKLLQSVAAGYLLTGDPAMGRLTEQYSKGFAAHVQGMQWDADDQVRSLMARAILPGSFEVTLEGDRRKAVDYTPAQHETEEWNTWTIHIPGNPYWGDIWAKNMRSKDDVPHVFKAAAYLRLVVAYADDPVVKAGAEEGLAYLDAFAKDIVDSGYLIRTKDRAGNAFVPDQDLASFVTYDDLIGPHAECTAKLSSALIAYGEHRGNDCGDGDGGTYEDIATKSHCYNIAIIRNFHLSAILHSLLSWEHDRAQGLVAGLVKRVDEAWANGITDNDCSQEGFDADLAVFLVNSAAAGLALTAREARLIVEQYAASIDAVAAWPNWDLWDPAVADGPQEWKPGSPVGVDEMAFFLEYCYSPFKDPASAPFIDCAVVADPSRWGE